MPLRRVLMSFRVGRREREKDCVSFFFGNFFLNRKSRSGTPRIEILRRGIFTLSKLTAAGEEQ